MDYPKYYLPIMPYLILNDSERFLDFAKSVFNAEVQMLHLEDNSDRIKHAEITIGKAALMFGNSNENWPPKSCSMFVFVDNVDGVLAKATGYNVTILDKPAHKDYGYSAGFEDPFGNQWWITQKD